LSTDQPLAPLFEADRLAIIGASDRNHYAVNIFKNLQNMGFEPTRIVPISLRTPRKFLSEGVSELLDVPGEIPLAVIAQE
jgi:hypothetical protein